MGLLEWFQPFDFSTFLYFFFNSVACDLISRHLFLLVLVFFFLLRACDFNQEMEIQKSTCCHSKYVLFRSPNQPAPGPPPPASAPSPPTPRFLIDSCMASPVDPVPASDSELTLFLGLEFAHLVVQPLSSSHSFSTGGFIRGLFQSST